MVPLGSVTKSKGGNNKVIKGTLATENDGTLYPAYSATGQDVFSPQYDYDGEGIVISAVGARCGKCFLASGRWQAIANTHVLIPDSSKVLAKYLYLFVNDEDFWVKGGAAQPFVKVSASLELQIPLPPLEVQKEIVAEIEGYQAVIDGARAVIDHYRPHIPIDPAWPTEIFGDVTSTVTPPAKIQSTGFSATGRYPIIDQSQNDIAGRTDDESTLVDGREGLVIFGDHTCAVKFVNERFAQGADGIKIIRTNARLLPKFVYFYLLSHPIGQDGYKRHFGKLKESSIPLPPLATQEAIVAEIEAEQKLVAANRELIARFEKKIQATLARIWGEETPAAPAR